MKHITTAAIIAATLALSGCNIQFQDTDRTKIMWDTYCSDTSLEWELSKFDDGMISKYTTHEVLSDKDIEYGSPEYQEETKNVTCTKYPTTIFGHTPKEVSIHKFTRYGKNTSATEIFIDKKGYVTHRDTFTEVSTNEADDYIGKIMTFETTETPLGRAKWVRKSFFDKDGKETGTETTTDEQGIETVKNLQ